jgi:Fic family protein
MGTSERSYRASHPWITFRIDLQYAGAEFWMLLGEARSKIDHLTLSLLKPDVAEQMHQVYLAKGAHATTAIEGNQLSEEQVAEIVAGRAEPPPPSQRYQHQEVENILAAFNRIKDDQLSGGDTTLTVERIRQFDRGVLVGLDEDDVLPGEIPGARASVVVGPYRGAPREDCLYLVEQLCEWLNGSAFDPPGDDFRVPYALIKAICAHLYLAWIHPFDDGNGRTARLVELQILLAAGVPMPATHLLSNHYNATRTQYYRELRRASESGGDVVPFLRYAVQGFVDGIRGQVERIWEQQYADRWEQYVYETMGRIVTEAERRRLRLALTLSREPEPVLRRNIASLDANLARAYAGTERMLSRDLNALEGLGLIESLGRGAWRAKREQILAFRPARRNAR